ncbi:hypothetical protein GCM10010992_12560 [Cloacibacterium rupense]|uniref:Uncharacterized protein n=1 Tax=Cloacibacterium rupense TaxID=517423 RepID=A0ABQ2NJG5_9FLAO|nr:hypothetical protein GCM10010992_12560 [Cloacibacterium rupense]
MTTIIKDMTDISFTDFDFQVLKICGTKVMQESVPAIKPSISGLKFINNKILTNLDKINHHLSFINHKNQSQSAAINFMVCPLSFFKVKKCPFIS